MTDRASESAPQRLHEALETGHEDSAVSGGAVWAGPDQAPTPRPEAPAPTEPGGPRASSAPTASSPNPGSHLEEDAPTNAAAHPAGERHAPVHSAYTDVSQHGYGVPTGPPVAGPAPAGPRTPPPGMPAQPHPYQPHPYQPHPYQPGGYPQQPPQAGGRLDPRHADDLASARLLKQSKRRPQSGWRRAVYIASGHLINPGESQSDVRRRELIAQVNQPLRGCYKIAMLSLKGGVGKTTTTTTLGSTFASLRGDRVIAVDANPDRGTLSQKIPLETTATVRHLLRDAPHVRRYSDIRAYTSQGPSRLEVLASEQDPAVSEAFSEDDYRRTVSLLEHFYNIVLTDCGTGLMHSAMKGVLDIADSLVIVSSGSVDGARSASATLDWLEAHGYRDLVARSVAVINSVRPGSGSVDLDKLAQHFGARCRAVCRIPFDPHLEEGAEIELERLTPETRLALLQLAATVADDFPNDRYRNR